MVSTPIDRREGSTEYRPSWESGCPLSRGGSRFDLGQGAILPEVVSYRLMPEKGKTMRWNQVILPVSLLGCVPLLSGCVTSAIVAGTTAASNASKTSGTQVDQAQIDQFQKGVATVADVEAKLGQPQKTARNPDGGLTVTYTGTSATGNAQSYVGGARWAKGSETTITTRNVAFAFDSRGKLVDARATESSLKCKFGECPG